MTQESIAQGSSSLDIQLEGRSVLPCANEDLFLEGQDTHVSAQNDFPEGGRQAWLVVFGSFCCIVSTWGLLNSIGVFQAYVSFSKRAFPDLVLLVIS